MRNLLLASAFLLAGAVGALAQTPVNELPLPGTIQGRIVVSASSKTFTAANVTMAPASAPFPTGNLATLNFVNESPTNSGFICIQGGTASTTAGCTVINPMAAIQITFPNPGANQAVPTFFSGSGCNIDFWN